MKTAEEILKDRIDNCGFHLSTHFQFSLLEESLLHIIVKEAMEIYGNQQWNAAVSKMAEKSAESYKLGWNAALDKAAEKAEVIKKTTNNLPSSNIESRNEFRDVYHRFTISYSINKSSILSLKHTPNE